MKNSWKKKLRNEGINIYAKKEKRTRRNHENWLAAKAEGAQWTQAPPKNILGAISVTIGMFGMSKRPG